MIIKEANYIECFSLNDAWREVMWACVLNGYDYVVKGGSYVGQIRKQLSNVSIKIKEPWIRPLSPYTPPPYPPPTSDEKIEKYFLDYIISEEVHGNEDYTYGSFISPQIQRAIKLLKETNGNTNQACISIGDRNSIFLNDPPCLRTIAFKVVNNKLNMSVFFRSWDLYAGFPENLGGLQLLKEFVLSQVELDISDGCIFAYSDGLHLYDQYFDLVNVLNIDKVKVSESVLNDKIEFSKNLE